VPKSHSQNPERGRQSEQPGKET